MAKINNYLPYMLIVLLLMIVFAADIQYANAKQELKESHQQYETQQTCDRSRTVIDGKLEKLCGDLQDKYGTEYICDSLAANAYCWVEQK